MKLREVKPFKGPDLARVIDYPDDQANAILEHDKRRGISTWEIAPDDAEVTDELASVPVPGVEEVETPAEPATPTKGKGKSNAQPQAQA